MTYSLPYLDDQIFLKNFDKNRLQQQFVKIIVLDFKQNPIEEIQGKIISGSISLDGSSGMRRTANLSLLADEYQNDLTNINNLLSINKKIEILVGFTNNTDKYLNYPIIWFPQGIYVIITPSISYSTSGINISLTLHDKMALLNGECGGTLPASTIFNEIQDVDEQGNTITTYPTIYQIIQQLVHHFGGQNLGKIIISDIDNKIKKVMKWVGSSPLYMYEEQAGGQSYVTFSTNYEAIINKIGQEHSGDITTFNYGEDVGYVLTDFIYPTELMGNAGDSVTTILDQIRDLLGNYEYFYDINGNFRFQQIKNYLNTSYSTFLINNISTENYLVDYTNGKSVYTFEDADIIQSFSNSPQFQQIKNDFVVWGTRKGSGENGVPIRYHLAIDKKPSYGNDYQVFFYVDPEDGIEKAKVPLMFETLHDFPTKGQPGVFYYGANENTIYYWGKTDQNLEAGYQPTQYVLQNVRTNDFRSELYLQGASAQPLGIESNYYYTELKNQWTKLYDLKSYPPGFKQQVLKTPSNIDFFLDFIDTSSALGEFSVQNIGRRTAIIENEYINCIFEPNHPNIVLLKAGDEDIDELKQECERKDQQWAQVSQHIYNNLSIGGVLRSAYEQIKQQLYSYTNYNQQVSLITLPIYYLEPNSRITIQNRESGISGDYLINSISLPLDVNGTMSINCTRAMER